MATPFFNRNSVTIRLLMIGILILVLVIPSLMINSLIEERQIRKDEAIEEITSKWAHSQTIGGPVITIPYEELVMEKGKTATLTKYIQVLPKNLVITGDIKPKIRYRGIYKAVLYNSNVTIKGDFAFAGLENLANLQTIQFQNAFMCVQIPDMRGIKDNVTVNWNQHQLPFGSGIKPGNFFESGISVKIPLNGKDILKDVYHFSIQLNLNGSEEFFLLPLGQKTIVSLKSNWPNPSFDGAFIPEKHQVTPKGFSASWKVLDLNRNYPQQWIDMDYSDYIKASAFGVRMISPVNEYTKTSRAIKYIIMFVGLTFLIFFLVEIFNKKRIHPVQYLLIGLSLCIFYVLLLSLSEHILFEYAYLIAAIAIISLISFYVRSALGGNRLMVGTTSLLTALYLYLYILLQNQDYALLMGSTGLFIIMAAVMYFSRNIEWYKVEVNE